MIATIGNNMKYSPMSLGKWQQLLVTTWSTYQWVLVNDSNYWLRHEVHQCLPISNACHLHFQPRPSQNERIFHPEAEHPRLRVRLLRGRHKLRAAQSHKSGWTVNGQSYKHFTIVINDCRVVLTRKLLYYDSRVVIYEGYRIDHRSRSIKIYTRKF